MEYHPDLFASEPLVSVLAVDETSVVLQGFLCAMADVSKHNDCEETPFDSRDVATEYLSRHLARRFIVAISGRSSGGAAVLLPDMQQC